MERQNAELEDLPPLELREPARPRPRGAVAARPSGAPVGGERSSTDAAGRTSRLLRRLTGERPFWFCFPGLCHDARYLRIVARRDEQAVGGIASGDAHQRDPGVIVSKIVRDARPGGIVVFHMLTGTNV